MGFALQLLFTGIGVGSIYALVALGFVLIYRATNVVNFAHDMGITNQLKSEVTTARYFARDVRAGQGAWRAQDRT